MNWVWDHYYHPTQSCWDSVLKRWKIDLEEKFIVIFPNDWDSVNTQLLGQRVYEILELSTEKDFWQCVKEKNRMAISRRWRSFLIES